MHPIFVDRPSFVRRQLPPLIGVLLLSSPSIAQGGQDDLDRAKSLAAQRPAEALQSLERALGAGLDTCEVHLLHAELLLHHGEHEAARTALGRAEAHIARDQARARTLQDRIAAPAASAQATNASREPEPPAPPETTTPAAAPARDFAREADEAKALRSAGDLEAAGDKYVAIAKAGEGPAADKAKEETMAVVRALAARAATDAADPDQASRDVEAARRHAESLRTELDDPDRALEAIEPLAHSKDEGTRRQTSEQMLRWIRDDVRKSNAAHEAGDQKGSRRHARNADSTTAKLAGTGDDETNRRGMEERCGIDDPAEQRRALENYAAWARSQVQLAEDALRRLDRAHAKKRFANVKQSMAFLAGRGAEDLKDDLNNMLADSADPDVANAAKQARSARADELEARGRSELEADEKAAAAKSLAAAHRSDPSRFQLGMEAVRLFVATGQRAPAFQLCQQLARSPDAKLAASARQQIAELQAWATKTFLAMRADFEATTGANPEAAMASAHDQLTMLDPAKVAEVVDAIATATPGALAKARQTLTEMGARLASGAFPATPPARSDAGTATSLLDRPPEVGESFTAALGLQLRAIQPGSFTRADGTTRTITRPFWATESAVTPAQLAEYQELHRIGDGTLSWNTAMMFCIYVTRTEREARRLPANYAYTLPTEAEWELLQSAKPRDPSGPQAFAYEWCLDSVNEFGKAHGVVGDMLDPCSTIGAHRVCRSADPCAPRRHHLPWDNRYVTFRMVLAPRPEMAPPYDD